MQASVVTRQGEGAHEERDEAEHDSNPPLQADLALKPATREYSDIMGISILSILD